MDPCAGTILPGGGLEPGNVSDWTQTVSNTFSPLCTTGTCGTLNGSGPQEGTGWAWFGGPKRSGRAAVSAISQTITIPRGSAATLSFWVYVPRPSGGPGDVMQVFLDTSLIFQLNHTQAEYFDGYVNVQVPVDQFADGKPHALKFISVIFIYADGTVFLDDICLTVTPPTGEGEGEGEGATEGEGEGEGEGASEGEGEGEGEGENPYDPIEVTTLEDTYDIDLGGVRSTGLDPGPDGLLSLREALYVAAVHPGNDQIRFAVSGVITLAQPLPEINDVAGTLDLDGAGKIVISGVVLQPGPGADCAQRGGLVVRSGGNRIAGLSLVGFCGSGIYLNGVLASGNTITNCRSASLLAAAGNSVAAVEIENAPGNTVGPGNVFSGNEYGVLISGIGAFQNQVIGNILGADATGKLADPNSTAGVVIESGAGNNLVGGGGAAKRNLLSGNGVAGIWIKDYLTENNVVSGNFIGVDITGAKALPNGVDGVQIEEGASRNLIGGDNALERNIISGNPGDGVNIFAFGAGFQTLANHVTGNYVGTDVTGTKSIPNGIYGVEIAGINPLYGNYIGGSAPGEGNIISGNAVRGVHLGGQGAQVNYVQGNVIGLDARGVNALPNGDAGVLVSNGSKLNIIGGAGLGEGNTITGNTSAGIILIESTGEVVQGNRIGLDYENNFVGNGFAGVEIFSGSHTVGGTKAGEGNLICGHFGNGIYVEDGSNQNTFRHNRIFANDRAGIRLHKGANAGIETPQITRIAPVQGLCVPNGKVDFFADTVDEGLYFIGETTANGDGIFLSGIDLSPFAGLKLTATVTDSQGNTSGFSAPIQLPGNADPEGLVEGFPDPEGLPSSEGEGEGSAEGEVEGEGSAEGEGEGEGATEGEGEGEGTAEGEGEGEGSAEGEGEGSAEGEGEGEGEGQFEGELAPYHSGDLNRDHQFNLSEILRLIQFYNSGGFHCDPAGEDGYNPGTGDTTCEPHASDYLPQDWQISLSEILRLIQFYNSGGYHPCPEGEDGFCPGR